MPAVAWEYDKSCFDDDDDNDDHDAERSTCRTTNTLRRPNATLLSTGHLVSTDTL